MNCFILSFLFQLSLFAGLNGPGDSLLYNKDDPRNPDCPCHKYQRKADREFKRFIRDTERVERTIHTVIQEEKRRMHLKRRTVHTGKRMSFRKHAPKSKPKRPRLKKGWIYFFRKDIAACPKS